MRGARGGKIKKKRPMPMTEFTRINITNISSFDVNVHSWWHNDCSIMRWQKKQLFQIFVLRPFFLELVVYIGALGQT